MAKVYLFLKSTKLFRYFFSNSNTAELFHPRRQEQYSYFIYWEL